MKGAGIAAGPLFVQGGVNQGVVVVVPVGGIAEPELVLV